MSENRPLVSFIVTCYNLPVPMLCECIDSILALTLLPSERELIIVDDGSDTSPMNGLMHYGDDIVYVRQKHGGVSEARNAGLHVARGTFVQFVDGDDRLLADGYGHCIEVIRQHADAEVVMFDFTRGEPRRAPAVPVPAVSGSELMRQQNIRGAVWCCLFRQSVRGTLLFTPGIAYAEDEEFMAQLLLRAEVVYVLTAEAYYYRQHSASAVSRRDEAAVCRRLDDTHTVIMRLHRLEDRLPRPERVALQRRVAQLTMDYLYNTIMLTRSAAVVDSRINELHGAGLFPLPARPYSAKYTWFRRLVGSAIGRRLLLHTLPYMKRER